MGSYVKYVVLIKKTSTRKCTLIEDMSRFTDAIWSVASRCKWVPYYPSLPAQPISVQIAQPIKQKPINLCATCEFLTFLISLVIVTIINLSHDLRFVLCSRDLDILRAQRIIGFLITYKSARSQNPIMALASCAPKSLQSNGKETTSNSEL